MAPSIIQRKPRGKVVDRVEEVIYSTVRGRRLSISITVIKQVTVTELMSQLRFWLDHETQIGPGEMAVSKQTL